jgi:hypothetical protein
MHTCTHSHELSFKMLQRLEATLAVVAAAVAAATPGLLDHAINLILIIQFEHLGCLVGLNTLTIEQKAQRGYLDALALRVGFEYLGHFRGFLDFEKRFFARLRWYTLNIRQVRKTEHAYVDN